MEQGDPMSQHFAVKEPDTCAFPQFRAIHSKRKHTPFTLVHQYDDQRQLQLCGEVRTTRHDTTNDTHHPTRTRRTY